MATKLEVINQALDLLEEESVTSVDDAAIENNPAPVRWMLRNYGPTRDALLRRHPWNFALARTSIASAGATPSFEWAYSYGLPTDAMRLLPLTSDGTAAGEAVPYQVEGRSVLTDAAPPLQIRYIKSVVDADITDPLFIQAFAATLAFRAAHLITGKQQFAQALQAIAAQAVAEAQRSDAVEGSPAKSVVMNMALDLLAETPAASPSDDQVTLRWLGRNYAVVRDALLRRHSWNFAIGTAILVPEGPASSERWANSFVLPDDFIRLLPLETTGTPVGASVPHVIEGASLLTDQAAPVSIRYVKRITDETKFDPLFKRAFAATLASQAAILVAGRQGLAEGLLKIAQAAVAEAQVVDAIEGSPAKSAVANMVLDMLGEGAGLTPGDDEIILRWLSRNYDIVRDGLLRRHPWNFAIATETLVEAATPDGNWAHAYTLPTGFLRLLPLTTASSPVESSVPHTIEGDVLLTDQEDPVKIRFIRRITDENKFDPLFKRALAASLAAQAALLIGGKQGLADGLMKIAQGAVAEAQTVDAIEGSPAKSEVANMVLDMLAESVGVTPGDDEVILRWLSRNYATIRDGLLRRHPWNFAIERTGLGESDLAPDPIGEWDYAYTLPADLLRLLPLTTMALFSTTASPIGGSIPHAVENNVLLTDLQPAFPIRYIKRVTDETKFDPLFKRALAAMLASQAAMLIGGKQGNAEALYKLAQQAIAEAQSVDAIEGSPSKSAVLDMAYDLLGENALADDQVIMRWMSRNYVTVRDALLRRHPWNFAMKVAVLASPIVQTDGEWSYGYTLPADCLRLLPLTHKGAANGYDLPHAVHGATLYTDYKTSVTIRYVSRITDEDEFDALFKRAFAADLAGNAALMVLQKQQFAAALIDLSRQAILEAQMVDALEGTPSEPLGDDWVTARSTGVLLS